MFNETTSIQLFFADQIRDAILRKVEFDLILRPGKMLSPDAVERHLRHHLYFVTIQPKMRNAAFDERQLPAMIEQIDSAVMRITSTFVTRSEERNVHLNPFMVSCFDAESSRVNAFSRQIQIPHFHALMLLHPRTIDAFDRLLFSTGTVHEGKRRLNFRAGFGVDTMTFDLFDPERASLQQLSTYVTKYARNPMLNSAQADLSLVQTYPRKLADRYPFFRTYPEFKLLSI